MAWSPIRALLGWLGRWLYAPPVTPVTRPLEGEERRLSGRITRPAAPRLLAENQWDPVRVKLKAAWHVQHPDDAQFPPVSAYVAVALSMQAVLKQATLWYPGHYSVVDACYVRAVLRPAARQAAQDAASGTPTIRRCALPWSLGALRDAHLWLPRGRKPRTAEAASCLAVLQLCNLFALLPADQEPALRASLVRFFKHVRNELVCLQKHFSGGKQARTEVHLRGEVRDHALRKLLRDCDLPCGAELRGWYKCAVVNTMCAVSSSDCIPCIV
ncbi:ORF125 [Ranid herpesvirus 1]|uniref:ORF125 n=1 Tax=Ranid herpesvirus 1 TaxID=85655 RepID=Q14VK5_9VIRU|nr:ORF125 [Ranid herpesvirus 1]ABG25777.1 ORF125 [Ranid herpesvirus 1]